MSDLKEFYKNCMKPLSSKRKFFYDFVGFDVETYSDKNIFLMGGVYFYVNGEPVYISFWNKDDMADFVANNHFFQGKYIVATNLSFDFMSLFWDTKHWNDFKTINKGSDIILAVKSFKNSNKKGSIKFIDTFNYAHFSVEKLGKIIKQPKIAKPNFLGEFFDYKKDFGKKEILEEYNKNDCKISCDFMYFLQKGINEAGGKLKTTIASCSLDVWRRNFLNEILIKENYLLKKDIKSFIFKGYYGGRVEAYKKGLFKDVFYYDVNSLYPSVMRLDYPLPNSVKEVSPTINNIINFMGVSECNIITPKNINKPLLPVRFKEKLIFPVGEFMGTYNHCELKRAIELGYKVEPLNQIIYTKSWKPFKAFVEHFYSKRLEYKKQGNDMEYIFKLILNSLYGKFAQKKIDVWKLYDLNNMSYEDGHNAMKGKEIKFIDEEISKVMVMNTYQFNGVHSFPILSSYVTSYARLLMYDYLIKDEVLYTDTDSVITSKESFVHSDEIGLMKLEGKFDELMIIRPKFYYCENKDDVKVKIKGLNKATVNDFFNIVDGQSVTKQKFTKIRESIRRGFVFNQIIPINKKFLLKDDKRKWHQINKADKYKDKLFESEPLEVFL